MKKIILALPPRPVSAESSFLNGGRFRNQIILFVTNAPEVLVRLHFIVIDKVGKLLLSLPQVYQLGDEINARLNGMYKARLQRYGETLRLTAELRALGLSVVAHPEFAQVLHIVHVEPHHVP